MDWSVIAHAWSHIADARHGDTKGFVVIKVGVYIVGIHSADGQDESAHEEGTDEERHETHKGLHHLCLHDVAIHADRGDSTWMKDMGELVLQHPIDDAEAHTLKTTTGTARTGSHEHDEEQDRHQLNRPNGVIDCGETCSGLQGDDGKEAMAD